MSSLIGLAGGSTGADYYSYTVDNSCRFNATDSAHMTRTNAGGDQTEFTVSFWVKRSNLAFATTQTVISQLTDGSNFSLMEFIDDALWWWDYVGGVLKHKLVTTRLFRDPSAWYHIVYAYDSDQGTPANRIKLYVNGTQVTAFSTATYPASAYASRLNGNFTIAISARPAGNIEHDGYLAEFVFIDGDQLTAASFGETNDDGIWVPKDVSGLTFANESFYLDFKVAPGTGNGAGTDVSGEANHFTDSGLAANDKVADSPTNNWCTLNSQHHDRAGVYGSGAVHSDGNLTCVGTRTGVDRGDTASTMGMLADGTVGAIYYAEVTINSTTAGCEVGIASDGADTRTGPILGSGWQSTGGHTGDTSQGSGMHANTSLGTYGAGDVIGFIVDCENEVLWVTKNGTYLTGADSGIGSNAEVEAGDVTARNGDLVTGLEYLFYMRQNATGNSNMTWNFGQHAFAATPPSNAVSLNETNLAAHRDWAITKGADYVSATNYTGNGSADNDINVGFDVTACLAVVKNLDTTDDWRWVDTVRGVTKAIGPSFTNLTEVTDTNGITAFGTVANNVRLGTGAGGYNDNTEDFTMFAWKEGAIPGFDIVAYTGTGSAHTEAHNLTAVPRFIAVKKRAADTHWHCYHAGIASDPETDVIYLSSNGAAGDDANIWNDTAPTSSVFTVGTDGNVNTDSATHIAYLWADVPGFSKHSHWIGNANADGPFIYCGFRPALIIVKGSAEAIHWLIHSTADAPYNPTSQQLFASLNSAAGTLVGLDILSNGFKVRGSGGEWNNVAKRYIFSAWAENPFPRSKAR